MFKPRKTDKTRSFQIFLVRARGFQTAHLDIGPIRTQASLVPLLLLWARAACEGKNATLKKIHERSYSNVQQSGSCKDLNSTPYCTAARMC